MSLEPPAAVLVASSFDALAYVLAHAQTGAELLLLASSRIEPALRTELLESRLPPRDPAPRSSCRWTVTGATAEPDRLWLLTSGSTGRPKRIGHTLDSLTTVGKRPGPTTLAVPVLARHVCLVAAGHSGADASRPRPRRRRPSRPGALGRRLRCGTTSPQSRGHRRSGGRR